MCRILFFFFATLVFCSEILATELHHKMAIAAKRFRQFFTARCLLHCCVSRLLGIQLRTLKNWPDLIQKAVFTRNKRQIPMFEAKLLTKGGDAHQQTIWIRAAITTLAASRMAHIKTRYQIYASAKYSLCPKVGLLSYYFFIQKILCNNPVSAESI